jgi:diacylglycerol kinase family enzyme
MVAELHLVWNPVAGNGIAQTAYETITRELANRGIPFSSAKSEYPGHAVELARTRWQTAQRRSWPSAGTVPSARWRAR